MPESGGELSAMKGSDDASVVSPAPLVTLLINRRYTPGIRNCGVSSRIARTLLNLNVFRVHAI